VPADRVYFAFASGRFDYDCRSCGAQCCRGHGYELQVGPELQAHLATAPAVRFFLDRCDAEAERHYHVRNCAPGCFFLTDEGECGIQLTHGYDAKPETCRLFPFNQLARVGEYLIVSPHTGLCPLQARPAGHESVRSAHAALLQMLTRGTVNLDVPQASPLLGDPAKLITLERRIVELSERHLDDGDYAEFAAAQLSATADAFGPIQAASQDASHPRDSLVRFTRTLYEVLGADPPKRGAQDRALVRTLVVTTPALRAQLVFRRRGKTTNAESHIGLHHIPTALLALEAMARIARHAGMRSVTYQTLMKLFMEYHPLIATLAHLDTVMAWRPAATIDLSFPGDKTWRMRYVTVARALLPRAQRETRAPLAQVLCAHMPSEGLARVTFLKRLAQRLVGRVVPFERTAPASLGQRLSAPRATLQHLVFALANPEILVQFCARGTALDQAPSPHN
jgi:Fe-S-cluster containining protein